MNDPVLNEAKVREMVDGRGLYISANVIADGRELGRVWAFLNKTELYLAELELPAGLGMGLRLVDLRGARLRVKRMLIPISLTLETTQGRFELRGFRGAGPFLAALQAVCKTS